MMLRQFKDARFRASALAFTKAVGDRAIQLAKATEGVDKVVSKLKVEVE